MSGPQVDDRCIGCDACTAVCENSSFERAEEPDFALHQRFVRGAEGGALTVSCRAASPGGVSVSCIARISWLVLLHCAVSGVSEISFDMAPCRSCPQVRALSHLSSDIALATHLAPALGACLRVTTATSQAELAAGPTRRTFARRSLLQFLRSETPKPSQQAASTSPGTRLRDALVAMFLTQLETSPDPLPDNWPFGQVTVDAARCDGCKACSAVCRSGALLREERGDRIDLMFDPAKCNRCGECSQVCHVQALQLGPARLQYVGLGKSTLAQVRGHRCKLCGTMALDSGEGPCRLCRASGSRLRGARLRID